MVLMPALWYVNWLSYINPITPEVLFAVLVVLAVLAGTHVGWANIILQYTAAVKNSSLDTTSKAIAALKEVYNKDAKLATIMTAPTLSVEDKSAIIAELQKHIGGTDKADTIKNFLGTLAENNRLGLLKGVCEKFGELMSAARGELEMTITSASVRTMPYKQDNL
jgi:hypothetical protein